MLPSINKSTMEERERERERGMHLTKTEARVESIALAE
jgi:hypothetical protein